MLRIRHLLHIVSKISDVIVERLNFEDLCDEISWHKNDGSVKNLSHSLT